MRKLANKMETVPAFQEHVIKQMIQINTLTVKQPPQKKNTQRYNAMLQVEPQLLPGWIGNRN